MARHPPVAPPPGLRRFLGFAKLSPATLQAIARVVEQDDEFRARVAGSVDEESVGRAGWIWLTRPDGWEDELAELQAEADAAAAAASEERAERDARRRLAAARAAAERATAAAAAREQEVSEIRAELAEERAARRALESQVRQLEADLEAAQDARLAAIRQLKQAEVSLARRAAEAKEAKARLHELEKRSPDARPADAAAKDPRVDPAALGRALRAAQRGAGELADALAELEALTGPLPLDEQVVVDISPDVVAQARTSAPPPRRLPRALPGGVRDDSVEAVDYLLRVHGVLLAVDGYNVSMVGWPDMAVAEQRRRLVAALDETAARSGAEVEVIFDGADTEGANLSRPARQLVCVRFSPPGIEADDVLLDLVEQLPAGRPVVVASSDNRVRDGARKLGANLVHARQLVGALRR